MLSISDEIHREVILDILIESTKWKLDESDERDAIRLEVEHRARTLLIGAKDIPDEQGLVHDTQDAPRKKPVHMRRNSTERSREYRNGKVKVKGPDGKPHWTPVELCEQVPCKFSKTGLKWQLKQGE